MVGGEVPWDFGWDAGVWIEGDVAYEIERRPRGASRGKPAPTFVATWPCLQGHGRQPWRMTKDMWGGSRSNGETSSGQQSGQPWPDRFGTLQQMWERACPAKRRAGGARSPRRHHSQGRHMAALTVAKGKHSDRHFRYPLLVGSGDTWPEEIPYRFCRQASDCSWKHCHLGFSGR